MCWPVAMSTGMPPGFLWVPFGLLVCALALGALVWLAVQVFGIAGLARFSLVPASDLHQASLVAAPVPSPLETVRERYARGEIDTAAFEEIVGRLLASDAGAEVPPER